MTPDRQLINQSALRRWRIILVVAGCLAYLPSLQADFIFDDRPHVIGNPQIQSMFPFGKFFELVRPLGYFSFALNYQLHGNEPLGYHLTNLTIHLFAGLVVMALLYQTLTLPKSRPFYQRHAAELAGIIATLWVVHPLQTQAVTYVYQRFETLMGLCYLCTLYAVIRGASSPSTHSWYFIALCCQFFGQGCKHVIVTAPLVVMCYDRVFLSNTWRSVWISRRWLYLGMWAIAVTAVVWRFLYLREASDTSVGFRVDGISPLTYLLTQPGVILHYLRLSIWPDPLCLDYWSWPLVTGLSLATVPPLLIVSGCCSLVAFSMLRGSVWGFIGLWFFVILAPTSSFVPIADVAFEHRMYLSLASVLVVVVLAVTLLLRWLRSQLKLQGSTCRVLSVVLLFFIIMLLVSRAAIRNCDYRTEETIWLDVTQKRPDTPRAHYNLGTIYLRRGELVDAKSSLLKALRLLPQYSDARNNYGLVVLAEGDLEAARQQFAIAVATTECQSPANHDRRIWKYQNLGKSYLLLGNPSMAILWLRRSLGEIDAAPPLPRVLSQIYLAMAYIHCNDLEAANRCWKESERLLPDWPQQLLAIVVGRLGQPPQHCYHGLDEILLFAEAICQFRGSDQHPRSVYALAECYARCGRWSDAIRSAKQAIALANRGKQVGLSERIRVSLAAYVTQQPTHR